MNTIHRQKDNGTLDVASGHGAVLGPVVSAVIPLKDEEAGLDVLFERIVPILDGLGVTYEVVCVNDGSQDGTLSKLLDLRAKHTSLTIVDLSRNFGKEAALTAGLFTAKGQAVIPIDADLQDPPELIVDMLDRWRQGAEVVLAIRSSRASDSWFKRVSANWFYGIINNIADSKIPANSGDYRLMDRCVVDALKQLPERSRFNKGLFAWLGFRTEKLYYERPVRAVGDTKWNAQSLFSFALDGITSFSSLPLRIWSYVGLGFATSALLYAAFILVLALQGRIDAPGYASLMVVVLFSTGMILLGLGIIGEYLARIFLEVKQRPLYIVRGVYEAHDQDEDVLRGNETTS